LRICDRKGIADGYAKTEVKEEKGYKGEKNQRSEKKKKKKRHAAYIIKAAELPVDLGCFVSPEKSQKRRSQRQPPSRPRHLSACGETNGVVYYPHLP
jgi:hypothetical protein